MIWISGRTLTWQDLSMAVQTDGLTIPVPILSAALPKVALGLEQPVAMVSPMPTSAAIPMRGGGMARQSSRLMLTAPAFWAGMSPLPVPSQADFLSSLGDGAVSQQILNLAAMADLPLPIGLQNRRRKDRLRQERGMAAPSAAPVPDTGGSELVVMRQKGLPSGGRYGVSESRWSGDGWLLMRQGGGSHALAGGGAPYGPTYGANQTGAVLRYRLMPGSSHKLTAYARAYGALNGTGEREVAAGLSLRPIPALPVIVMAEMRGSQFQSGKTHARPAVGMVSEIPPVALGKGIEAETYAQAGYVGGAAPTPFIDGQIRIERRVDHGGKIDMRLGIGAWGGAQYGANRLDIGPTLRIGIIQGRVGARLAVDYRLRIKGNAVPTSGPALTLSAGF